MRGNRAGGGVIRVLEQLTLGMAGVDAEAQHMVETDRRAQLDLAADPGRGVLRWSSDRRKLVELITLLAKPRAWT